MIHALRRSVVVLGPCLALSLCVPDAHADQEGSGHEIRLAVLAHDVGGVFTTEHDEPGFDLGMEGVLGIPVARIYSGVIRPNLGFTWNNRHATSKVYSGLLGHWRLTRHLTLDLAFGGALHNGERETRDPDEKELGSRLLSRSAIELGWQVTPRQQLSVLLEHISNAGLADENEGMDLLGLRWGWRF